MAKAKQLALPLDAKIQCPSCKKWFAELDVHPDDQLCGPCEGEWVEFTQEMAI